MVKVIQAAGDWQQQNLSMTNIFMTYLFDGRQDVDTNDSDGRRLAAAKRRREEGTSK